MTASAAIRADIEAAPRSALFEARGIVKRFGGVLALRGVDFTLEPGEVHALCGENGAGKSTLIKVLSGVHPYPSYDGELLFEGKPVAFSGPRDATDAGIAVIHQELSLVPELGVAENLFLGREPRRLGLVDWERLYAEAQRALEPFGLADKASEPVSALGIGQQQLVEIAKAVRQNARILILDEPTAALADKEVRVLLQMIRRLCSSGVACVYISHKLDEVLEIADRITVLRDGWTVASTAAAGSSPDEIIHHMVGRGLSELFPRRRVEPGPALLSVRNLSVCDGSGEPRLQDLSFEVAAGEVLGIGGLMGAGRSELLLHLFGIWGVRSGGSVTLAGEALHARGPADCIARGLVLVTEDRKRFGLVLEHGVGDNLALSRLTLGRALGLLDAERLESDNRGLCDRLRIKCRGLDSPAASLSGGNQQKVVLGKALSTEPQVVLLDEPTRGIDVGAKAEVYELVNRLTEAGKAVILVSSELPELIGISDRIVIMHAGKLSKSFDARTVTQERLLQAAMGRHEI